MKCKSKFCDLESGHNGRCARVVNKESDVVNSEAVAKGVKQVPGSEMGERLAQDSEPRRKVGRQTAWQQANREKYNAKMREHMRKKRAAQSA